MPKLLAKVKGIGNGIKTVAVNASAIAKALNRPTTYVTKFFGCELGAQVQMNAKEDRYIVKGAHHCEKLQHLLDGFIKRFVLCLNYDTPETKLESKSGTAPETKVKGKSKGKKNARAGGTNQDSDEASPNEHNEKSNGTSKHGDGGDNDEDED